MLSLPPIKTKPISGLEGLEQDGAASPRTPVGAGIPPQSCPGAPRPRVLAPRLPTPPEVWLDYCGSPTMKLTEDTLTTFCPVAAAAAGTAASPWPARAAPAPWVNVAPTRKIRVVPMRPPLATLANGRAVAAAASSPAACGSARGRVAKRQRRPRPVARPLCASAFALVFVHKLRRATWAERK